MPLKLANDDVVLLDIEGTTSSIAFVKKVLFPYCHKNVLTYLTKHDGDPSMHALLNSLLEESNRLNKAGDKDIKAVDVPTDYETIAHNVRAWIDKDLKLTPLKELQGRMWTDGYHNGDYHSHVYDDTPPFFRKCKQQQHSLYIYSSGSVLAQKLLFEHTEKGNLTEFIADYFDTHFGAKTDRYSYEKICASIGEKPERVLFVTDVEAEARAAKEAGCKVAIMVREGNVPLSDGCKSIYTVIRSFDEIAC